MSACVHPQVVALHPVTQANLHRYVTSTEDYKVSNRVLLCSYLAVFCSYLAASRPLGTTRFDKEHQAQGT